MSKGPLKQEFLDLYLTAFFGVPKLQEISDMRVIFFWKMLKIESKSQKCKKKIGKFFLSEIIASQDVPINCLY